MADQLKAMKAINDFWISQMVGLPTYFAANYIVSRKNVKAFDDSAGGTNNLFFGSFYRNSYLWDMQ